MILRNFLYYLKAEHEKLSTDFINFNKNFISHLSLDFNWCQSFSYKKKRSNM